MRGDDTGDEPADPGEFLPDDRDLVCLELGRVRAERPRIEVENVETALDIAARGHADTIAARGVVRSLAGQLPQELFAAPLRPKLYDHFAIVHRHNTTLSRATHTLIELATARLQRATAPSQ
ncbi:hypothetical protein ACFZCY_41025 [Streptomyces sp. NPDC007983]|uniref:hypothetical protein n=1 Tax=Streptomyces sp. NPDC007983 TaxID=3364800 RepID=UPI0036EBEF3C